MRLMKSKFIWMQINEVQIYLDAILSKLKTYILLKKYIHIY